MASRSSRSRRRWCAGVAACAVVALAVPASAPTAPPDATEANRLDAALRYLSDFQNPDGGFSARPGRASDWHGVSQWAALAFAAAGINPRDQGYSDIPSVYDYLTTRASGLAQTDEIALTILVAGAAGVAPDTFGGVDLVARLYERLSGDGFSPTPGGAPTVEATAVATIAFGSQADPSEQAAWARGVRWLTQTQAGDGGWSEQPGGESDPWLTGLALSALAAGPTTPSSTGARIRARAWMNAAVETDGGLAPSGEASSDSRSTAAAALGLWAAGDDPRKLHGGQIDLLDWLGARQQPSGAVNERTGAAGDTVAATAFAALAFAAQPPPVAAPGRKPRKVRPDPDDGKPKDPAPKDPASKDPRASPTPTSPAPKIAPPTFGTTEDGAKDRKGVRRVRPGRDLTGGTRGDPGTGEGDGDAGSVATPGAPDRPGGGGGAAGNTPTFAPAATAGAAVAGDARKGGLAAKAGGGPAEISGTVIGASTDDKLEASGRSESAPGLAGSQAGDGDTPWLALAIAGGVLLGLVAGPRLERRRTRFAL